MRFSASELTIREIIGQLMMPMLPDTPDLADRAVWDRVQEDQERFGFGGYIVFRGDRKATPPYLSELQDIADVPLLFAADLERGCGQHLAGATLFPAPMALGAAQDPDLAFQQGGITALEARQAGIHWVLAPTLDLAGRADNPIVNVRAFGDEPRRVGMLGEAFIAGVQRYRAIACAKHFPGHGDTTVDSHTTLPSLDVSRYRLENVDLTPFRHVVQTGVKSVMIGHLAVPALDESGVPATMSRRVVSDLLREQMRFEGLIITDALNMGAITERYSPGDAAVRALQAGVDVLLMPPDPAAVVESVLRALEEGALTKQRLLDSVERIFQTKQDIGIWGGWEDEDDVLPVELPDYEPAVAAVADAAVTLVHDRPGLLPLHGRICSVVLDDDASEAAQAPWLALMAERHVPVWVLTSRSDAAEVEEVLSRAAGYDTVVVPMFMEVRAWKNRVALEPPLAEMPGRLKAAGCRVGAVSFTSPFLLRQFPEVDVYACAYGPHPLSQRAAVAALWGELPFSGRLPVDLSALSPLP